MSKVDPILEKTIVALSLRLGLKAEDDIDAVRSYIAEVRADERKQCMADVCRLCEVMDAELDATKRWAHTHANGGQVVCAASYIRARDAKESAK